MGLQAAGIIKRITASGGGTVTVPNDASYKLVNVYVRPSTNDTYVQMFVGGTQVQKIRVKGKGGNHLPYPQNATAVVGGATSQAFGWPWGTVFDLARALGKPLDIPTPAGETLEVTRYAEAGDVTLVFDEYAPGDIKSTDANGSRSNIRRYLNYMTNAAAYTTDDNLLDTTANWAGLLDWPIGGLGVPKGHTISLLAIMALAASGGSGAANKGYTTHLRIFQGNDLLFDIDRYGLPLLGDATVTADATSYATLSGVTGMNTPEYPVPAYVVNPAMPFGEGAIVNPRIITADAAADGIEIGEVDVVFFLEHVVS